MKPLGPVPAGFAALDGELAIGGVKASALVERAGQSPLFVYSADLIRARVAALREGLPARLGLHFALIVLALAALWRGPGAGWGREALLFVCGALGLAFFGHLGQAYQTSSPLWQPLAAWLGLFGPLFLLCGQGRLAAGALAGALIGAGWLYAIDHDLRGAVLAVELPTALPLLLAPMGAAGRQGVRAGFWQRLEEMGLRYALGGASLAIVVADIDHQAGHGRHGAVWLLARRGELSKAWLSLQFPHGLDFDQLVELSRPDPSLPELCTGPHHHLRSRDGFKLTDRRMTRLEVHRELPFQTK